MRLFLYYALHSFVNQIKKLCKSWFLIFFLACFLIGGIIGGVLGFALDQLPDEPGYEDGEYPDEEYPDEEYPDEEYPDEEYPDEPLFPDEEGLVIFVDFIASAIILIVFILGAFAADKNGSAIFMMADVNLLFQAPKKPQSVLLFKLMTQILLLAFSTVYIAFQIPAISIALGLGAFGAFAFIFSWLLLLVYSRLLSVLIYTVTSTHERLKKYIRPACVAIVLLVLLPIALDYAATKESFLLCAARYLSSRFMLYIPIFGWLKGLIVFAIEGNYLLSVIYFLLLLGGAVLSAYGIWHIKADFYEDAMAKSEQTAAAQAAALAGTTAKRKKDRVDRIKRDGLSYGSGANMFFFKAFYNRFRFAYFKVFTKTSIFHLLVAGGLALLFRLAMNVENFVVIGIILSVMVFFRSLGNPLAQDMDKPYFVTIPSTPHEKVLWSLLGGSFDTALDTLPALIFSGIVLAASPLEILAFWLLAIAVDFYSNNVMLFIELSLPSSIAVQLKQMVMVLFIYFGLIPIALVALFSYILTQSFLIMVLISALSALAIAFIFFAFSPLFLQRGRK